MKKADREFLAATIIAKAKKLPLPEKPEGKAEPDNDPFTDEQRASERVASRSGISQPGFRELAEHMDRFGPDGVLDSAIHLPQEQYEKLAVRARKMSFDKTKRKWTSSRS